MQTNKLLYSLLISISITGCATSQVVKGVDVNQPTFVQQEIINAANAVDKSVKLLIEIENTKQGNTSSTKVVPSVHAHADQTISVDNNTHIEGLDKKIKIKWDSEPLDLLISNVAKVSGYNFSVGTPNMGKEIKITVDIKNVSAGDVLKNLGEKLGNKARIVVNRQNKTIVLHYTK